ncbi:hypothetical protein Mia14_0743 [Candidatus Mancarchaeum acidiphilum]|uniref:Uncharacterized protein n=1 Tax=Candidatus Mancarchaeum acidiphilum TaxID=1920749 RepID=A0A218NNJ4_9ARCH|nr:hypothetical protein [Candidatus Mancarchaeum acidiphilum]ASI14041.1 hypothetical protein Mia14_0743 [Candidatus Mancarchaeum acidiphilum]
MKKKIAILILVVVMAIIFAGIFAYLSSLFAQLKPPAPPVLKYIAPSENVYLTGQNLLFYNYSYDIMPYTLLDYAASNVTGLYINESILQKSPPSYNEIYILNYTNDCLSCSNPTAEVSYITNDLIKYRIISNYSQVQVVSASQVASLPNNSILIIMNGRLPISMMGNYSLSDNNPQLARQYNESNTSVIGYALMKGISIIYIGNDFSSLVGPGDIVVPDSRMPSYLSTSGVSPLPKENGFYFTNRTFVFNNGRTYGPVSYTYVYNGTIIAFSNYLSSWPSLNDSAYDIAKSISQLYWIPTYISGTATVNVGLNNVVSGSEGVFLNSSTLGYSYPLIKKLNSGIIRIVAYTNSTYGFGNGSIYNYLTYKPDYKVYGKLGIQNNIVAGSTDPVDMDIFTNSSTNVNIVPHLAIYYTNMTKFEDIYLTSFEASGNFSLIQYKTFTLPPGQYIAILRNDLDFDYASALFTVPPISVTLSPYFTKNVFTFTVYSQGKPISGIPYSINVDGKYTQNGTVENGVINYTLPKTAPKLTTKSTFNLNMLSTDFVNTATPPTFHINSEYIEAGIVFLVAFIVIVFVHPAPRDEFYIDVSNLPVAKKQDIRLKDIDLIGAFDKLNTYYHWRYMPLTVHEFRTAVSNYIRSNNIPVNLTLNNINTILTQMVEKNELVSVRDLYAPKSWITLSKHDIAYLAIFKELRMFMISHAITFTDLDSNDKADMVIAMKDQKANIIIYSKTSKFKEVSITPGLKTFIVFLSEEELNKFKETVYSVSSYDMDLFRIYLSSGLVKLVSLDNLNDLLS